MKKILLTFVFLLFALPVSAVELLMFSNPHCKYCQSFLKEVKPTYHETEYSKYLPLKVITMEGDMPEWIARAFDEKRLQPIRNTPTFVIWDNKELARLIGYRNKETFYELLGSFMEANEGIFKQPEGSKGRGPLDEFGNPLFNVIGVDKNNSVGGHRIKSINKGSFPFDTNDEKSGWWSE